MKQYKIVGIEKKKGEYQGHPWENFYFHCELLNPENPPIAGIVVKSIKVGNKDIANFSQGYTVDSSMIGRIFTPLYDEYTNLVGCQWVK